MAKIFNRFVVQPILLGGTYVEWQLHPQFRAIAPFTFTLQWSRSGDTDGHDWFIVNSIQGANPVSVYALIDEAQRTWSTQERLFYRVQLNTSDGLTYASDPQPIWGTLPKDRFLLAREILRGRTLLMKKKVGISGLLFKRKDWGTRCTNTGCVDWDTQAVTNISCPICYGTGWVGGYYKPMPYHVEADPTGSVRLVDQDVQGQMGQTARTVKGIACPTPRSRDIFLDCSSDERWIFETINATAEFVGYPLILQMEQRLLPPTHVAQTLERDHAG